MVLPHAYKAPYFKNLKTLAQMMLVTTIETENRLLIINFSIQRQYFTA
jgi:hypothetical protein